jgi:hypothetical protein
MLTCQQCRRAIDGAARKQPTSAEVAAHIETCASCRAFQTERIRLQALIGELEPVGAPADFEFRLRARMATQPPAAFGFELLRLTPRALGLACAACLVCAFALALRWYTQRPAVNYTARTPQNIAQVSPPTSKGDEQINGATINPASNNDRSATAPKPFAPRRKHVSLEARDQLAGLSRQARTDIDRDVHDLSLHAATTLSVPAGGNSTATLPIPVEVSASARPLQVLVRDPQGAPRLVNIEPVSFGSHDLLGGRTPSPRIVAAAGSE